MRKVQYIVQNVPMCHPGLEEIMHWQDTISHK